jgi:uncharacterized membrane protein
VSFHRSGASSCSQSCWLHAGGNILLVLIEAFNFYIRYTQGPAAVLYLGLVLSLIGVGTLLFTGWMGWEMVYRDRAGITDGSEAAS